MGDDYTLGSDNSVTITLEDWDESGMYTTTFDNTTITIPEPDPDFVVIGDIIQQPKNGERINVTEIIHEQKLQIQALTDMIGEMVETKNFDIEWDLEKRVEQKKFLTKLREDPNDL